MVHGLQVVLQYGILKEIRSGKTTRPRCGQLNEAGLPKFPGLVRYDEVSAGHIDHALAIGIPAMQNTWVWPARSVR